MAYTAAQSTSASEELVLFIALRDSSTVEGTKLERGIPGGVTAV